MHIYSKVDVYGTPLSLFKVMSNLDETRVVIGKNTIWLVFSDGKAEVLFFLGKEDSLAYRKEIGEEEE